MKILAASLPEYFPSITFFRKMLHCDVFVIADDLQYSKHSPVNRTKIKTPGNCQWLTVPVLSSKKGFQNINHVKIVPESNWQRKHAAALKSNYKYSPFFEHYFHKFEKIFLEKWEFILQPDMSIIEIVKNSLRIKKDKILLSDLGIKEKGTNRIIEMASKLNCDSYLVFKSEVGFINKEELTKAGIELHVIKNESKPYMQQFDTFEPNLSVIDLLFNMGNESLQYLKY